MQRRIQIVNNSISSIREIKIYNAHNAINESLQYWFIYMHERES